MTTKQPTEGHRVFAVVCMLSHDTYRIHDILCDKQKARDMVKTLNRYQSLECYYIKELVTRKGR